MLVQLGDEPGAVVEMQRIARRAPGSADMRAALAALYWSQVQHSHACHLLTLAVERDEMNRDENSFPGRDVVQGVIFSEKYTELL